MAGCFFCNVLWKIRNDSWEKKKRSKWHQKIKMRTQYLVNAHSAVKIAIWMNNKPKIIENFGRTHKIVGVTFLLQFDFRLMRGGWGEWQSKDEKYTCAICKQASINAARINSADRALKTCVPTLRPIALQMLSLSDARYASDYDFNINVNVLLMYRISRVSMIYDRDTWKEHQNKTEYLPHINTGYHFEHLWQ